MPGFSHVLKSADKSCQSFQPEAKPGRRVKSFFYEVDPMLCPECGGKMRVISFLTDYAVVDRIIAHLKLPFVAERPPPPHLAYQEVLIAAESSTEYLS